MNNEEAFSAQVEVCEVFDTLSQLLEQRKILLLEQIQGLADASTKRNSETFDSLKNLRTAKSEFQNFKSSVKGNLTSQKLKEDIADIEKKIIKLESTIIPLHVKFSYDISKLMDEISNFGIIDSSTAPEKTHHKVTRSKTFNSPNEPTHTRLLPNSSSVSSYDEDTQSLLIPLKPTKPAPLEKPRKFTHHDISVVTKYRPPLDNVMYPNGVCIHEETDRVFICDNNGKVQVCSIDGKFISQIGKGVLKNPYGVVIQNSYLFITDMGVSSVFKFSLGDYSLVTSTLLQSPDYLFVPDHITCSNDEIFVVTSTPNISVFNSDLLFDRELNTSTILYPTGIAFSNRLLFVLELDTDTIHTLEPKTGLVVSKILTSENSIHFSHANNFCIDENNNFLITDLKNNLVKKVTVDGTLIKTFDTAVWECYEPNAIAITETNKIIITLRSGGCKHLLLQYF